MTFQHVHSMLAAIQVLNDQSLDKIRVEGTSDAIDIEIFDKSDRLVIAKQVKTKVDRYTWSASQIVGIITKWLDTTPTKETRFEFVTDGRLGPTALKFKSWLELDGATEDDLDIPKLDLPHNLVEFKSRIEIRAESVKIEDLYEHCCQSIEELISDYSPSGSTEHSISIADKLFTLVSFKSSNDAVAERVITKKSIAEVVGGQSDVPLRSRWLSAMKQRLATCKWLPGEEEVSPLFHDTSDVDERSLTCAEVISKDARVICVTGPGGTGKSTAVRALCDELSRLGKPFCIMSAHDYFFDDLEKLVAAGLRFRMNEPVATATAKAALGDQDFSIVIDDVSEVPHDERRALLRQIRMLADQASGARVILAGREPSLLEREASFKSALRLEVSEWTSSQVEALVRLKHAEWTPEYTSNFVATLKGRLQGLSLTPLLVSVSISLGERTRTAVTKSAILGAWLDWYSAKISKDHSSLVMSIISEVFVTQNLRRRSGASESAWLQGISNSKGVALLADAGVTPLKILEIARSAGILVEIPNSRRLSPVHDSLASYMVAASVIDQSMAFPGELASADAEWLLLLGEMSEFEPAWALQLSEQLPMLALGFAFRVPESLRGLSAEVALKYSRNLLNKRFVADTRATFDMGGRVTAVYEVVDSDADNFASLDAIVDSTLAGAYSGQFVIATEYQSVLELALGIYVARIEAELRETAFEPFRTWGTLPSRHEVMDALTEWESERFKELERLAPLFALPTHPFLIGQCLGNPRMQIRLGASVPADGEVLQTDYVVAYAGADRASTVDDPDLQLEAWTRPSGWGQSTARFLLRKAPRNEARKEVKSALNREFRWRVLS